MNRITFSFNFLLLLTNIVQCRKYLVEVEDEKGGKNKDVNPTLVEEDNKDGAANEYESKYINNSIKDNNNIHSNKDFQKMATELINNNEEEVKEMDFDGVITLDEMKAVFAKNGQKLPTMIIEKFRKLDTNKNGKLEKSELKPEGEGEDYWIVGLFAAFLAAIIVDPVIT